MNKHLFYFSKFFCIHETESMASALPEMCLEELRSVLFRRSQECSLSQNNINSFLQLEKSWSPAVSDPCQGSFEMLGGKQPLPSMNLLENPEGLAWACRQTNGGKGWASGERRWVLSPHSVTPSPHQGAAIRASRQTNHSSLHSGTSYGLVEADI